MALIIYRHFYNDICFFTIFVSSIGPGQDYSSVLETLSTVTSEDSPKDYQATKELARKGPVSYQPRLQTHSESEPEEASHMMRNQLEDTSESSTARISNEELNTYRSDVTLKVRNRTGLTASDFITIEYLSKCEALIRNVKLSSEM